LPSASNEVLIDGSVFHEAESLLNVTNHDGVTAGVTAGEEGSLYARASR
jgi:hypothetical protein